MTLQWPVIRHEAHSPPRSCQDNFIVLIVIVLILHSVNTHMQSFLSNQIYQSRLVSMQSLSIVCTLSIIAKICGAPWTCIHWAIP